jgi:hypothetical protein
VDANALAKALRTTFRDRIRMFNTSSGAAVDAGANWRRQLLAAMESASVVILWATNAALQSKEVAFEIGAAYAYERTVIPCCVHISPELLPWGLAERQALQLDNEDGWRQLAEQIAGIVDFQGALNFEPLESLAQKFEAPSDALSLSSLGYTIEIQNRSDGPISSIHVQPADEKPTPQWAAAVQGAALHPGESLVVFREHDSASQELAIRWQDVTGAAQQRRVFIPAIDGEGTEE